MRRREFITLVAVSVACPLGARGESLRRIGTLFGTSRERADGTACCRQLQMV